MSRERGVGSMRGVKIRKPGLLTTVQDLGRYGYQKDGMVVAGAMDAYSFQLANILVGNPRNSAALEITLLGPELIFSGEHLISICGAASTPLLNGEEIPMWRAIYVQDGDVLELGRMKRGCRSYLAMAGGIAIPKVLGSYSTYLAGSLGGWQGRALQQGDILPTYNILEDIDREELLKHSSSRAWRLLDRGGAVSSRGLSPRLLPKFPNHQVVRVTLGPQLGEFEQSELSKLLSSTYLITPDSNRMGYRLEGEALKHKAAADIISDAIPLGAIQIPANGQPIILMADRQPTGGYTKIAVIISVDIAKVAQLAPGDQISFQEISLHEAERMAIEAEKLLRALQIIWMH